MSAPRILFHRDFLEYTGGHGKVWDYFRHAIALGWDARVFLTPRSLRGDANPWSQMPSRVENEFRPEGADILFLAGMDWAALEDPRTPGVPVINLVQHVRHAWEDYPLRQFLKAPAHRICVSGPVADAIKATGEVNGPVSVIPAALDFPVAAREGLAGSEAPVVIAGMKQPVLARELAEALQRRDIAAELMTEWMPRSRYLERVAAARVAVMLPHLREGFYLPALEAMALGVPVVTLDCIGSREYQRPGENCLVADPDVASLEASVGQALEPGTALLLVEHGRATAMAYTLEREREAFGAILDSISRSVA